MLKLFLSAALIIQNLQSTPEESIVKKNSRNNAVEKIYYPKTSKTESKTDKSKITKTSINDKNKTRLSPANCQLPFASCKKALPNQKIIEFSEIMTNPKGKDQNNEWIEFYNPNNEIVDMKDWKLQKANSKDFEKINESLKINANGYTVWYLKKMHLNNNGEKLYLLDNSNQTRHELLIRDDGREGEAFSMIRVQENGQQENKTWKWTMYATPNSANPIESTKIGKVTQINFINQSFTVETDGESVLIQFPSIQLETAELLIKPNNVLKAKIIQVDNNNYLEDIELISINPMKKSWIANKKLILLFSILAITLISVVRQRAKNKENKDSK